MRVHVPPIVIVLVYAIAYSWRVDLAECFVGDVAVDETQGRADGSPDGGDTDHVLKLLDADTQSALPSEVPCWMTQKYTTEGPCQECDEHAMQYASYCCSETGFRQRVRCEKSEAEVFKSCPKSKWAMERSFWTFEGIMLALGMSSFVVVIFRRRALDWEALQRVKKQIANSV